MKISIKTDGDMEKYVALIFLDSIFSLIGVNCEKTEWCRTKPKTLNGVVSLHNMYTRSRLDCVIRCKTTILLVGHVIQVFISQIDVYSTVRVPFLKDVNRTKTKIIIIIIISVT